MRSGGNGLGSLEMAVEHLGDELADAKAALLQAEGVVDWWRTCTQVALRQLHDHEALARRHRDERERLVEENRRLRAMVVLTPGRAA